MEKRKFKGKDREDRKFSKRDGDDKGGFRRGGHRPQRVTIPKGTDLSYKNLPFLQKCLTERGKILSRRLISGSAKQQRLLCIAVKRARLLGLLPSGSSKRK